MNAKHICGTPSNSFTKSIPQSRVLKKEEFFLLELNIHVTFALFKNLLRRQVIGRLSDTLN